MCILRLRTARGWNLQKNARVFLVDFRTLMIRMRQLDESGERPLVQTVEPVGRRPDLVPHLVQVLQRLQPAMRNERIADVLARAGLRLGATTVRRMIREPTPPPEDDPETAIRPRRSVDAKYPGHTWHVDLTTVPTRVGHWVSWLPYSLPRWWPFCGWVGVAIDQVSRAVVGTVVFAKAP